MTTVDLESTSSEQLVTFGFLHEPLQFGRLYKNKKCFGLIQILKFEDNANFKKYSKIKKVSGNVHYE
jgi:hypothetical protein